MFDAVIKNGIVVDGTRAKPYAASVYIKDGKIAEISADADKPAKTVYDAAGHIVAPGFIDIHSHSDLGYVGSPTMNSKSIGGVTFELVGQCGGSIIPLNDRNIKLGLRGKGSEMRLKLTPENYAPRDMTGYAKDFAERGAAINVGMLIGHGTLRSCIIGWEMRQLTETELQEMCDLLDKLLEQGALGISFGLIYPPGSFCDTAEIIALAKVVAKHDKILSVHMRNENKGVFDALDEMIEVALKTGVKLQISHLKLMGVPQYGKTDELFAKIELARAKGVRIHADQYPYTSSSSGLTSSFPKWVMEGGAPAFVERLKDDAIFAEMIKDGLPEMYNRGGPENITVVELPTAEYPEIIDKTLIEIAEMLDMPLFDAIRHILIKCNGQISCHYKCMDDTDLLTIMSRRDVCTCSDGRVINLDDPVGKPHPRYTGTFTRFLRLVRENDLMPIQDAIYKITGLPATLMGLDDQFGYIKPGMDATLTIFDYETLHDNATFAQPTLTPTGIDYVIVNGELILDHGVYTDARPGKVFLK